MSVEQEILVTGIKVVDLLAPYAKGGKIGMLVVGTYFPNSVGRKKSYRVMVGTEGLPLADE